MSKESNLDELKKLLTNKKIEVYAQKNNIKDREKLYAIENLLNNDRGFFYLEFDVAISILEFLGVEKEKMLETYNKLIDPNLLGISTKR